MKFFLSVVIIVLIVAMTAVYLAIPATIIASKTVLIPCNPDAAYRFISQFNNLKKVCDEDVHAHTGNNPNEFVCDGIVYKVDKRLQTSFEITIAKNKKVEPSQLAVFPISKDFYGNHLDHKT